MNIEYGILSFYKKDESEAIPHSMLDVGRSMFDVNHLPPELSNYLILLCTLLNWRPA